MDNKAKKILFQTYWSGKGWKEGKDRYTSPEDFAYAKEKGLMFDPITISHDECVKRVVNLANNITIEQVAKAFLCSLSTRRLDWRSAVSSYYIAKLFTVHKYTPEKSGCFYDNNVCVPEAGKHDWTYATYWRGEDGYDRCVVEKYFGKYL